MNDNHELKTAMARLIEARETPTRKEYGGRAENIDASARTAGASAIPTPMLRLKTER
jgi:hypothetical protein